MFWIQSKDHRRTIKRILGYIGQRGLFAFPIEYIQYLPENNIDYSKPISKLMLHRVQTKGSQIVITHSFSYKEYDKIYGLPQVNWTSYIEHRHSMCRSMVNKAIPKDLEKLRRDTPLKQWPADRNRIIKLPFEFSIWNKGEPGRV